VAFAVEDTGIGVSPDKQRLIFGSVSAGRCRNGPEVWRHRAGPWRSLVSWPQSSVAKSAWPAFRARGSTFTLYLPLEYTGPTSATILPFRPGGSAGCGAGCAARPRRAHSDDRDDVIEGRTRAAHHRG